MANGTAEFIGRTVPAAKCVNARSERVDRVELLLLRGQPSCETGLDILLLSPNKDWNSSCGSVRPTSVAVVVCLWHRVLSERRPSDSTGFNRIAIHFDPLRWVVDGTRTRKPRAYLGSWFILTIYFAYWPLYLLLTHAFSLKNLDLLCS